MTIKKNLLQPGAADEIDRLKKILLQHKEKYKDFKSFVKTCDDALIIADSLLNNDFKTFKKFKLKFTKHTAQKMKGIESLSTYKKVNKICLFMSMHGGICASCYADKSINLYDAALTPLLIYNTLLLKYIDIASEQIPYINSKYFRFEAFSDIQGSQHLKNLIAICNKNKSVNFALWTKAGATFYAMLKEKNILKLPSNLLLIFSEWRINHATEREYTTLLNNINKQYQKNNIKNFIVYDNEKLRADSGFYQCKKNCITCLKCYKKSKDVLYIAEMIH